MGVTEKAVLYSLSRFSWELGEVGAAKPDGARLLREAPAAFGRLCVETSMLSMKLKTKIQPPSGGCVLKHPLSEHSVHHHYQPPSGGCVLKHPLSEHSVHHHYQPPSGGCVLKPNVVLNTVC